MIFTSTPAALDQAAQTLVAGGLVAFPTETVYGLGADAGQQAAVAKIYALKGRPTDHPLIVHVLDGELARVWAAFDERAQRLIEAFWPGPLTLVLARRPSAPVWACGGQSSIGLRCPAHPVAQALLTAFAARGGVGVAAPSANRFGKVSPTCAEHVAEDLGRDAPMILAGRAADVGVESTILDLTRRRAVILRPGRVGRGALEQVLGEPLAERDATGAAVPRVSGSLAAHYQPQTPLERVTEAAIAERMRALSPVRLAVWSIVAPPTGAAHWEPMPARADAAEQSLYATLRRLDRSGVDRILVVAPPAGPAWEAVNDRLLRAAAVANPP